MLDIERITQTGIRLEDYRSIRTQTGNRPSKGLFCGQIS